MTRAVNYLRPYLYPKQARAFFNEKRISCCEASTKAGKTHAGIVWLSEQAIIEGAEGRNYWWVAPIFAQAKIAYKRFKRYLPKGIYKSNESELTITLANGAVISFKSAENPDSLYGDDVHACVIDEASRMKEESFHAVRSTLTATRGKLRCIGNVKGRKNWFYILCRKGQSGDENIHYEKITALDAAEAGVIDMAELVEAKQLLPKMVFRELYMAEPTDDGGNPFGLDYLKAAFRPDWQKGEAMAYGADLAKVRDWSVMCGLDASGVQVDVERWRGPLLGTTKKIAVKAKQKKCAVDSTGMGIMPAEVLSEYGNNFIGYTFTSQSKQRLIESLVVAIQRGEIIITDQTTYDELVEFEYQYTRTGVVYGAPSGYHDDCVIALALANYAKGSNVADWGVA